MTKYDKMVGEIVKFLHLRLPDKTKIALARILQETDALDFIESLGEPIKEEV